MNRCLHFFCLFFILSISFIPNAQTISVIDSETGSAVPGCVITCSGTDGSWKYHFLTDTSGSINLNSFAQCINDSISVNVQMTSYLPYTDLINTRKPVVIKLIPSMHALDDFVVTGSYVPESTDNSIHQVRVINRARIEQQGAVTLKDVLVNENNLRISQDGVLGSSLSIMGVSGENIKIMIDGVPIIGRLDGSIDLSQISLNDIERIEIIEGPLSTVYGTNALGGTINLITKKEGLKKWSVQPGVYYESSGQYNSDIQLSLNYKKNQVTASFGRNFFDGWSDNEELNLIPAKTNADSSRFKTWKPKTQYFSRLSYQTVIKNITVRPFASYFSEEVLNRGLPRNPYNETAFDDRYNTSRYDAGFQLSSNIGNHNLNIISSYNAFERIKNTWYKDLTSLEEILTTNPGDQDTSNFGLLMSRGSLSSKTDSSFLGYQLGYDASYEMASGARIENSTQNLGDYAIFGSINWSVLKHRLEIQPGVRYAYNTDYKAPVVPSFNFKFKSNKWTYRGSYANGFRAPSLKELYFQFVDINHDIHGNQNLQAEKSHNVQIAAQNKIIKPKYVMNNKISVFYNNIYNKISLATAGANGLYQYVNIDRFISQGIKIETQLIATNLSATAGFSYVGRENIAGNEESDSKFYYSPELNSNIVYRFKKADFNVALFYKYTGALELINVDDEGNLTKGKIDDYHTMDLTFSKNFINAKLQVVTGVKNIFDVTAIQNTTSTGGVHQTAGNMLTAWGRTCFLSLKYNLSSK